jgi:hypothetical protein
MRIGIVAAAAAFLASTLTGCAATQSTEQIVLRYNRAFAQSRNEVLLLNILRAAAREPLQFSTMGTVSGSVGNGGEISIPFTNILVGGEDSISPTLRITDAVNPTISIAPLAYKEFVTGLLTPIGLDDAQLFLHSGWDAEFLLPLIVGGVICSDGRMLLNSGEYWSLDGGTEDSAAFRDFFRAAARAFGIRSGASDPDATMQFDLTDEQTLELMREGVGEGRVIGEIAPAGNRRRVSVRPASSTGIAGMEPAIDALCTRLAESRLLARQERMLARTDGASRNAADPPRDPTVPEGTSIPGAVRVDRQTGSAPSPGNRRRVVLRSVASIIHYLGESHRIRYRAGTLDSSGLTYWNRDGRLQTLFLIDWRSVPGRRAVQTRFQDVDFWVAAIDLRAGEGSDRTLKTLSFLDQIIALQTSGDVVRGTQPLITVGGQ